MKSKVFEQGIPALMPVQTFDLYLAVEASMPSASVLYLVTTYSLVRLFRFLE